MKVFLSWSGPTSRAVAEILREWMPEVIQALEPWISSGDIDRGANWSSSLTEALAGTKAGIICITAENQEAAWLNFEAGALSKTVGKTMVCPYLFGIKPAELKWPLAQFQVSIADKDETFKLIETLNGALERNSLEEKRLQAAFDRCWPDLESRLSNIKSHYEAPSPRRSQQEILEEILDLVRDQSRQSSGLAKELTERLTEATSIQSAYSSALGYINRDAPRYAHEAFNSLLALQALTDKARPSGRLYAATKPTDESRKVDDEKPLRQE
jgi:hypothetical protein